MRARNAPSPVLDDRIDRRIPLEDLGHVIPAREDDPGVRQPPRRARRKGVAITASPSQFGARTRISSRLRVQVVQLAVDPFLTDQLLVGADLPDPPVLDDDDPIGVPYRGKAVGDDEVRPSLHEPVDRFLHERLAFDVKGARRFVEYEDLADS